jgi:hypothetical protein
MDHTRPATPRTVGAHEDASSTASAHAAPSGMGASLKFVGRVAQLDLAAVSEAIASWRETMRHDSGTWFAAEEAVARAVVLSGRRAEQQPLLMHVADAFSRIVWYGGRGARAREQAPELRVQASEASGQYLATLAMLALLVREELEPSIFALLYEPFAPFIPLDELAPE